MNSVQCLSEKMTEPVLPVVMSPSIGFRLPIPCWTGQIQDFPVLFISGLELMSGLEDSVNGFIFRLY